MTKIVKLDIAKERGSIWIEAVEIPGDNFILAVQWHPEERLDDIRLFVAVVHAAARYATGKVNA